MGRDDILEAFQGRYHVGARVTIDHLALPAKDEAVVHGHAEVVVAPAKAHESQGWVWLLRRHGIALPELAPYERHRRVDVARNRVVVRAPDGPRRPRRDHHQDGRRAEAGREPPFEAPFAVRAARRAKRRDDETSPGVDRE